MISLFKGLKEFINFAINTGLTPQPLSPSIISPEEHRKEWIYMEIEKRIEGKFLTPGTKASNKFWKEIAKMAKDRIDET